jgi:tRNA wybutosine-synthesizing protein 1
MKPLKDEFKAIVDLSSVPIAKWKAERMYSQGYRFVGRHSAIKICMWTKKGIRDKGECYKNKFYGIDSHRCIQMSPAVFFCDFNCLHCWRSLTFSLPKKNFKWDKPEMIFNGCIEEQKKIIQGFKAKGNAKNPKILEAEKPKHFAISLSGEPALYPYLPEFIDLVKSKGMTAFLVTNGAHPEMIKKLIKHQPTNLYVTLPGPDKEIFRRECFPMIPDSWQKIHESLSLLEKFSCSTVIRLTLSKKSNMCSPEKYAEIIEEYMPKFVECKAYVACGGAREKMGVEAMPTFQEMLEFSKQIEKHSSYKIVNSEKASRVVLLVK